MSTWVCLQLIRTAVSSAPVSLLSSGCLFVLPTCSPPVPPPGLLCLSDGAEGGESGWSSSISVHNEILRTAPHLARVLADSWFFDRKGEVPAGKKPFFEIPVFNYHKGYLSVNYSDNYYHLSQRHAEVPRLGPDHHAAMELFNSLACSQQLSLRHILQPGDVQLLSNHTCLHYRGAFRCVRQTRADVQGR